MLSDLEFLLETSVSFFCPQLLHFFSLSVSISSYRCFSLWLQVSCSGLSLCRALGNPWHKSRVDYVVCILYPWYRSVKKNDGLENPSLSERREMGSKHVNNFR